MPENHHILTKIRAAITANIRPCAVIYREQPDTDWTTLDFQLLEAYQIIEDEKCPQCGNPVWLCRSTADNIEWASKTSVCQATKAKEAKTAARDKTHKVDAKTKAGWGRIDYVVPRVPSYFPEGTELPTRKDFYVGQQSNS